MQRDSDVRALVLRSAGTNCDGETVRAFSLAGAQTSLVHLNELARDPARLHDQEILVLPGGFSYGDYIAAGRVFGLELRQRLLEPLQRFVEEGGFVVGICNGFQILVELGLFEPEAGQRHIALTDNAANRFECRWITLRSERCATPYLVPGELLPAPVAHGEGRFVVQDKDVLRELFARGQVALTYVDPAHLAPAGADAPSVPYPLNPNGSIANIAGLCDPTGRVLGLMPHPERNLAPWHHPRWTRLPAREAGEGLGFYRRMVEAARARSPLPTSKP
ncbi:MAG: phosphoribosylformylglycinamidine synthase I [Planctomycetes bacterium]|nr:phosphoribosylformylglycinamidine synthase I [Planctomycetota bacterium]